MNKQLHALIVFILLIAGFSASAAQYYVSTTGSDSNPGTLASPFLTIQKGANVANAGDSVLIRGGTYRETVSVGKSGSAGHPITFAAYSNETVVVSAGDPVTGWTVHSGDIWKASCNWDVGTNGDGDTLFVDGVLKFEAREKAETDPMDINDWGYIANGAMKSTYFTANDLKGWGNGFWTGAKVRHHQNDWTVRTTTITGYDSATGKVSFNDIGGISQKHQFGYYIFGTLKALDRAGEWFKDTGTDTLYYQVAPGQNPNTMELEFRRREFGFDVRGCDYIRISGLTFRGLHIRMDSNTDYNTYDGCLFYGYDKNNYGRFYLSGSNNVFRDNEVKQSWGSVASISGTGHQIVNNYMHDIGYFGTSRVLSMSGSGHLVAYNTVRKIARSFLDGYPYRSEFCYNLFEDGARLSWDTGFFDGDSGRGNGGGCIVHHNVFRNTSPIGIYAASYAGLEFVHHHNIVYDVANSYFTYRLGQLQFGKFYHNTLIGGAPESDVNAGSYAFESAYNNNLQISLNQAASFGVDFRNNVNYSPSDFVDFNARDLRLAPGSAAIDAGLVLPGINDGYSGAAPDCGALEYGEPMWKVGHDFASPPSISYGWKALPGSNLFEDNLFSSAPTGWTYTGTPTWFSANTWNTLGTGYSRSGQYSMKLNPGDGMSRVFSGLKSNTWYTVATEVRLTDHKLDMEQYDAISGSVTASSHRGENYIEGLTAGEWVRYDNVDFGAAGKYDQMELTYSRPPDTSNPGGASLEVRLGSSTGPLLGTFGYNPTLSDVWMTSQINIGPVSGLQSLCFVPTGSGANLMRLATIRMENTNMRPDDRLTLGVRDFGGSDITTRGGKPQWPGHYETFSFKTGPTASSATFYVQNDGAYDAYFDRLALFEKEHLAQDAASAGTARQSSTLLIFSADRVLDGNLSTFAATLNESNSWWQVDLGSSKKLYGIRLTGRPSNAAALSNFRVSVWNERPAYGREPLWQRDYLTGSTLADGETLLLKNEDESADGTTALQDVSGRYVRVQILGQNNLPSGSISLAEASVLTFDETDLIATDASQTQGTGWWQAAFVQQLNIGEIEIMNVDTPDFLELSNFKVSVLDQAGGTVVWQKDYFPVGSVGQGASLVISGSDLGSDGFTRLASTLGRVVRVELNGLNSAGNNNLTFQQIAVRDAATVPPAQNVALYGEASQSANHYYTHGFADTAINSIIVPGADFTTAKSQYQAWWQVDLKQTRTIDQIVVYNRTDAADRLGNFRVSVWDGNPESGGVELWGKNYSYYSGDIPAGGSLTINGNVTDGGTRLDSVVGARFVRVQLLGTNLLSLPEVQVWELGATAPSADATVYVEAEDYESFFDTTAGNSGGVYRGDDVDIEARDGGYTIGWVDDGEWLTYSVDLMPGTYDFSARLAAIAGGRTLTATLDGVPVAAIPVPITGNWAVFQTVTVSNITVATAGAHQLRLDMAGGGFNLNWVAFTPVGGDGDADQMRDDWEVARFGDLAADPGPDNDGDGFSNLMEYYADTDPTDSNSWFYAGIVPGISGDVELSWVQSSERLYDICRTDDLTGSFTQLVSGIEFPQTNFVDGASLNHAFYQIKVRVP